MGMPILFGSMGVSPLVAWAMDGHDALADDMLGLSDKEEQPHQLWSFAMKIMRPVFFFFTLLRNLDNPIALLFAKVTVYLISRKPGPFSVYMFVDQLCSQFMQEEPHLHKVKSPYATKVEVQDYKLLCLANIVVGGKKFTLVGVLGDWWILPLLPSQETLSSLKNRLGSIFRKTTEQDPSSMPPLPSSPPPTTPIEQKDQMLLPEELVMFRDLIKVSALRAKVLEEACTRYPHLWEWHKNQRACFCESGYQSLSDLLLFLKTHAPKDLNEENLAKFKQLCKEVEIFQFDNAWIASLRQRVNESIVNEDTVRLQEKLEAKEANLLGELEGVKAELNVLKEKLSTFDVPIDF